MTGVVQTHDRLGLEDAEEVFGDEASVAADADIHRLGQPKPAVVDVHLDNAKKRSTVKRSPRRFCLKNVAFAIGYNIYTV